MKLTVLGAQGTWPGPGGECSGYLVSHDGYHLWLDAGTGTFSRLQEQVSVGAIGAVLISHGHADHFIDMIPAFYARHYGKLGGSGLPCYSPEGFMDLAALLVSENGRNVLAEAFAFTDVVDGETFDVGPFRVSAFEMTHIGVQSLGYRIEAGGSVLAYTGDTGPSDQVLKLAENADTFLCEATWRHAEDLLPFHMSARQAAEHAAKAGADTLVLTHIWPTLDTEGSRAEAAEVFERKIEVARGGMRLQVGR